MSSPNVSGGNVSGGNVSGGNVRGVRRRAAAIVALTVLAVIAFWLFSWRSYDELVHDREVQAAENAHRSLRSFEAQSLRLFDFADSYLRAVRHFAEHHPPSELPAYLAEIRVPHAERFADEVLAITDADGNLVFHSEGAVPPGASIAERRFFRYFRDHPQDSLILGETEPGVVAQQWRFRLVRPIIKGGRMAGLVILTMRPEHLAALFHDMSLGPHGVASILTLDGRLVARQPAPPVGAYGTPEDGAGRWDDPATPAEGSYRTTSAIDGTERTYVYRRLADYPAVVVVGTAAADIDADLAPARDNILLLAAAFSVAATAFCLLLLDMTRKTRAMAAAQADSARAARMLAEANSRLERSNADLEHFAYVASHDLQTPLRTIAGYAQLLERRYRGRLDSDADDFLGFIVGGTKRMGRLITDLLDYARVGSSGQPLRPVAAAEAVRSALDNLAAAIVETGAEISVGSLPMVMAEPSQLVSLFQNLIGNALKYRHPDRVPRIAVTAEPDADGCWRIAVADNGIGIDPRHFDKIFVIFERLETATSTEGTGVGLALCQRIAQRFGGDIRVDSVPEFGTTFVVGLAGAEAAAGD
jgi:signal transduction histidine kinase